VRVVGLFGAPTLLETPWMLVLLAAVLTALLVFYWWGAGRTA